MRGHILCNGSVPDERDFVRAAAPWLASSRHQDAAVRDARKVVLITAGWEAREFDEDHVKAALREVGVPSRFEDGYDVNQQNLSAWHAGEEFARDEPALAEQWRQREALIDATRQLYLEKNAFYIAQLRQSLDHLKARSPELKLGDLMADVTREFSHPPAGFDGDRLLTYFISKDVHDAVARLVENDDRMVELLHDLDEHFASGTGLHYNPTWRRLRARLEERILSASAIFIFGGHLGALLRCLNFFRLRDAFAEALRRGASFYTSSAGSLILCERIIVYNDFPSAFGPRREFQLFDRGFGLVRHLQIFPHCMDRIQTDDPDNLAYLAYRFQNRACVGLNDHSYLLAEAEPELAYTSVGERDGVYVFDPSGRKVRYDRGEAIPAG